MPFNALVSVLGPDHVGLVSSISSRLFDLGANLGDTSFAVLGAGAEFTAICEFTAEMDIETLITELKALPTLKDSDIKVTLFDLKTTHPASETITHVISVSGGDSPGLMARLCEIFEQFNANIVRLNSERVAGGDQAQYIISTAVSIPKENASKCLATIGNLAGQLGLDYDYSKHKI